MAMQSASLCLGIMSCECVDVMYSTGMCTHMAVITQTHTHAGMQQEYHVSPNWESDQWLVFKAATNALIGCFLYFI